MIDRYLKTNNMYLIMYKFTLQLYFRDRITYIIELYYIICILIKKYNFLDKL